LSISRGATAADTHFMREAIRIASRAKRSPGCAPIGCLIVREGEILAAASNETLRDCDPTAHAEIVAIRAATTRLQTTALRGATLYSTLQPCGMCTMASIWARIGRIVVGAGRHQVHRMYFESRHLDTLDFIHDAFRDDLTVTSGVLSDECAALYYRPDDKVPLEEQANI